MGKKVKVYTGLFTLNRVFLILNDAGLEWLMSGQFIAEIDVSLLYKHFTGKGSYSIEKVTEEIQKVLEYGNGVFQSLIGKDFLVKALYEAITRTEVDEDNEPTFDEVFQAFADFFSDTAPVMLALKRMVMGRVKS